MNPRTPQTIIDEEYLPARAKLLELAAILDRYERAGGGDCPKVEQIRSAISLLLSPPNDQPRTAAIQHLFSRKYQPDWREQYGLH